MDSNGGMEVYQDTHAGQHLDVLLQKVADAVPGYNAQVSKEETTDINTFHQLTQRADGVVGVDDRRQQAEEQCWPELEVVLGQKPWRKSVF